MKRFLILIVIALSVFRVNAQIDSVDVSGINCYNDTGHIYLSIPNLITLPAALPQWSWWHKTSNQWLSADTSFVLFNPSKDSLQVTKCGKYQIVYFDSGTMQQEIDSFFVPCPVTIVKIDSLSIPLLCSDDSIALIHSLSWGGEKFDPDSSIILYDSLSGDEYYSLSWYSASDSLGGNSILLTDTTPIISNLSSSWYQAIVTDAIGCSDTLEYFEITNPSELLINSSSINHVNCIADSTGSIQIVITGGMPNYSFLWNAPGFNSSLQNINNLTSNTYNLTVTDSFGCTLDTFFLISEPASYTVYSSLSSPILCSSDSSWVVLDSIVGGNNDSIIYGWIDTESDSIYVSAGTYLVFVEDLQYGCKDTISYTISSEYEIQLDASVIDISCFGDLSGSIIIDSIYGGNYPYIVEWSGVNPSNVEAGDYFLLITDSIGCTLTDTITINQNTQILSNPTLYPPSCNGFSDGSIVVSPTGGSGPFVLNWQNGTGTVDSLYGLTTGIYIIEISDSLGCSITDSITLPEPENLSIVFDNYSNPVACFGEVTTINAIINGGTGPFSLLWSNGDTSLQTVLSAGTYTITVTDINSCSSSNTITINQPDPFMIVNTDFSNPTCNTGATATVFTTGGTPPIQYIWSNGETTQTAININTSTSWVVVIDSCGNKDSVGFVFTPYNLVTAVYYDDITHIGSIEIDFSSSGGPFSYSWEDLLGNVISNSDTALNLCPGIYYIETTDMSNGCERIDTLDANYNLPDGILDTNTITVFPASNLWGADPYTYLWDNGEVTIHADLCPGNHWLEVTDINGCLVRQNFTIAAFNLTLDPASVLVECNVENNEVELEITVNGGISPYTYLWSNGSVDNPLIDNLLPGIYIVTITDNNGCSIDTSFTIRALSPDCIPNVFTPNGDQINDFWNLEDAFLFPESEVKIYNRFGRQIFNSTGYEIPWDGKNDNGKNVADGVYFYYIKVSEEYDIIKGSLTIIR